MFKVDWSLIRKSSSLITLKNTKYLRSGLFLYKNFNLLSYYSIKINSFLFCTFKLPKEGHDYKQTRLLGQSQNFYFYFTFREDDEKGFEDRIFLGSSSIPTRHKRRLRFTKLLKSNSYIFRNFRTYYLEIVRLKVLFFINYY